MATALLYVFDPVNQVWSPWDGTTGGGGGDIIGSRAFLTSNDTPQLVITNESSTPGADQAVIALVNPSNDIFIGQGPGNTFAIAPTADLTVTPFATFSATAISLNAPLTSPLKNNAANLPAFAGVTPTWQMMGDTGPLSIEAYSRYIGAAGGPGIYFGKSRSATVGLQGLAGSGDTLGTLNFFGSDGVAFQEAARIQVETDSTPAANNMPGRVRIFTTPSGSTTPVERWRVNNAGVLNNGASTPQSTTVAGGPVTPQFQVQGLTTAAGGMSANCWSTGTAVPFLALSRSKGAAIGTQGIVAAGDIVGRISFDGSDGVQFQEAARIEAIIDATPGVNDMPGRLVFYTTPDGSQSPVEGWRIAQNGLLAGGLGVTGAGIQTTRIGTTTFTPFLQIVAATTSTGSFGGFVFENTAIGTSPNLMHGRGRGTPTGPLIVNSGDLLGRWTVAGYDGAKMIEAGRIAINCEGVPALDNMPGRIDFSTNPGGTATPVVTLSLTSDGRLFGTALHNNAGAVTGTTNQYIASGTYTPTTAGLVNLDAVTPGLTQWIRVGNVVTVGGTLSVDPTAASVATSFRLSLPIASNLASAGNLGGAGVTPSATATNPNMAVRISGDATNDQATFTWVNDTTTSALNLSYSFTYVVL